MIILCQKFKILLCCTSHPVVPVYLFSVIICLTVGVVPFIPLYCCSWYPPLFFWFLFSGLVSKLQQVRHNLIQLELIEHLYKISCAKCLTCQPKFCFFVNHLFRMPSQVPFVLVEGSHWSSSSYVNVKLDGSTHSLPLTTVYHQLHPVQATPYTLFQAILGNGYPVCSTFLLKN
jgi:E3 Ubiquitin ligase